MDCVQLTFSEAFLIQGVQEARTRAPAEVLRAAGLTQLANQAGFDVFAKIKESIDKMSADLKQTQADEARRGFFREAGRP